MDELSLRYFAATNPLRKVRTRQLYDGLWRLHISPVLGPSKPQAVARWDIAELHRVLGEKHPATANRVVVLLSHFFEWCRENDLVELQRNPARGIKKYEMRGRQRYLSRAEFARLGQAITKAETEGIEWSPNPARKTKHAPKPENRRVNIDAFSAAALRLLIFTGARLREILNLEWRRVDLRRGVLALSDSKTGAKDIILGAPAIEVLEHLASIRSREPKARLVIEGKDASKPRADLQRPWKLVRDEAGLTDFRLHDLRHSFASVAAGSNLGLPVIGALLGHSDPSTTARYAHLAVEPLRAATDGITARIAEMLNA
jgi:integrase